MRVPNDRLRNHLWHRHRGSRAGGRAVLAGAVVKAIAGADIKPGMTLILKPGGPLVRVARIVPAPEGSWSYLYDDGIIPEIAWPNRWYVLAEEA